MYHWVLHGFWQGYEGLLTGIHPSISVEVTRENQLISSDPFTENQSNIITDFQKQCE